MNPKQQASGNSPRPITEQAGLSSAQQQFVLKFCQQLASVIQACEQSESAEIEVGRRIVGTHKVKVKLRSERES